MRLQGGQVRHDHSIARALNRGGDYPEDDQSDFLEDHGFVIQTAAIEAIIDPHASYTLEYIDMILSLKANAWKVLFVPTARLEFRIADFSWRDVPYFMYKRSEATCHGTRDYLAAKWRAGFPNTGFWTYIKYTIVESHEYPESEISVLPWRQQAQLFLGFFQMAGFNRYALRGEDDAATRPREYVHLLEALDSRAFDTDGAKKHTGPSKLAARLGLKAGESEAAKGLGAVASRDVERKVWAPEELKRMPGNAGAAELLPNVPEPYVPSLEADMPLEYLPFGVAKLSFPNGTCGDVLGRRPGQFWAGFCGVAVQKPMSCDCWINLPTFKSRSLFADALAKLASLLKVPSRVTTYLELFLGSTTPAHTHVKPVAAGWKERVQRLLKANVQDVADAGKWADVPPATVVSDLKAVLATSSLELYTCGGAATQDPNSLKEPCDAVNIEFAREDTVVHFSGRPPAPSELKLALTHLA